MPIRTILVILTDTDSVTQVMPLAVDLAERHGAHLTGVHAEASAITYTGVGMGFAVKEFAALRDAEHRLSLVLKAAFLEGSAGLTTNAEWRIIETGGQSRWERLLEHAHCADLVIMPQAPQLDGAPGGSQMQENVVRGCGRPVLIVPHSGTFETVGAHALVGLSPTRESARAAHDAINLINKDGKATILTSHKSGDNDDLPFETAKEMARCYARHGISVDVQNRSEPQLPPGDVLLNESFERGCDVIVVGAYGHSRVYDLLIGATTTHLMDHMTSPVLFSA